MTGPEQAGPGRGPAIEIAVAHDWLVRYAGSERVVEQILEEFPGSRLLTTLLEPGDVPALLRNAEPSLLQKVPSATRHHEWLVPLMPLAWRLRTPVADVDAAVSSSHACAKAVRIAPGIPHLCYCHTPMRYAWDFDSEQDRFPSLVRPAARAGMRWFRRWDRATAANVSIFVANPTAVAERLRRFYGRESRVIHPPVRTEFFVPGDADRDDFFLFVGRMTGYKQAALAVETFRGLDRELVMVGEGSQRRELEARASRNVRFVGTVGDDRLRELYQGARALVYPAEEDFGIAMAEAHACGTPVIGFRVGGAADIVVDGETGFLADRQSADELRRMVARIEAAELDRSVSRARAEQFSTARFRREIRSAVEEMVAARPQSPVRSPRT
jgi:glycosyltransferase involved in cell wall biosynthesis